VDRDLSRLGEAADPALVETLEVDLETGDWPLAGWQFGGIVVTNYLHRPLLPYLLEILLPGGIFIYETFAQGNERFSGVSNPDYLLQPGELLDAGAPSAGDQVNRYIGSKPKPRRQPKSSQVRL
jgi:hypothetical protein